MRFTLWALVWMLCFMAVFTKAGHAPGNLMALQKEVIVNETEKKAIIQDKRMRFRENDWVDSVYDALADSQRLAQLFMVAAFSTSDKPDPKLEALIRNYNLGGLIFMKGSPMRQARLTNHYQSLATTPMLIAMDAEWGLAMRLDSTIRYPYQITLGATTDDRLTYEMGQQIALQCNALGVHVSFSPVVDVNNNADNPVIGHRSFGTSKYVVANRATSYMRGLQDNKIIACAKHFPGHGDTDLDSHYDLPTIHSDKKRLDSLELYPFRHLIQEGVASVMVAHLSVPALDPTPKLASTLSKPIVTDLLRKKLGFQGLIFTDALNMKGVADLYPPGEVDALALLAGNDILLYSMDVPTAIARIRKAIADDRISWKELEKRVKKVLAAKFWAGLNEYKPVQTDSLMARLSPENAPLLQQSIYEQAVTLVRDTDKRIPLKTLSPKTLYIGLGQAPVAREAYESFAVFASTDYMSLPIKTDVVAMTALQTLIQAADEVVVAWHLPSQKAGVAFGLDTLFVQQLKQLLGNKKLIQLIYGNPYSLKYLDFGDVVVCGYEEHPLAFKATANALFGSSRFKGRLPVNVNEKLKFGSGLRSDAGWNLRWAQPESLGYDSRKLKALDSILNSALKAGATPGGQLVVSKGNQLLYAKAFGTLDGQTKASLSNLYDLASVTKIAASVPGLMRLYEQGKLPIDSSLAFFLPELRGHEKGSLKLRELLTHQAGLPAFLPLWKKIMGKKGLLPAWYRTTASDSFPLPLAEGQFLRADLKDSLYKWTLDAPLQGRGTYRYSDLAYVFVWKILEKQGKGKVDEQLSQFFYQPTQAYSLSYQPLRYYPASRIAPTEKDDGFRNQLLRGYVHDQQAAMVGGIAGHAGLFGTAADLTRLFVHFLPQNGGSKGLLWSAATLDLFTSPQYVGNRRGLGFDKPEIERGKASPTSPSVSGQTFGHSGFTGTAVWVDPKSELVFVFVSNRIYPLATNTKLADLNIRTSLQEAVYLAKLPVKPQNARSASPKQSPL